MSTEHPGQTFDAPASGVRPGSSPEEHDAGQESPPVKAESGAAGAQPATVLVRGETVRDPQVSAPDKNADSSKSQQKPASKPVAPAKAQAAQRLPALPDDGDVGVEKPQLVVRDGKADLAFTGTLIASVASPNAPKGSWDEYRVYATAGGKHVFSKIHRSVYAEEQDQHEAEIFEPTPSSVPSKLLRSAHELTRSRPLEWSDAAVQFFGYDPLAKALYRKLGDQFNEHIS